MHGATLMDDVLKYLLAAKRAEIQVIRQLALTCELVSAVGQFVHMLQRERGASNMVLASGGVRFTEQLSRFRTDVDCVEVLVRSCFARLDTEGATSAGSVRLFSRIAYVLYALDSLPALRERIQVLALSPDDSAAAFSRLVGGLLAVVFEAADAAADPDISRALVALFNFMQGKELAGQERATGVAGFALGCFDAERQQRLAHLIDAQERCFDIFAEFAEPVLLLRWQNALPLADLAELERYRRIAAAPKVSAAICPDSGDQWFDLTTDRIDAMKHIEDALTLRLSDLCRERVDAAQVELTNHESIMAILSGFDTDPDGVGVSVGAGFGAMPGAAADGAAGVLAAGSMSSQLGRSVLDLLQAQSQRIQSMADELNAARAALHERKLIERGKGVLMVHRGLTEDQAYRLLRQTAMDQGRRLVDVAESVLSLGKLLGSDVKTPPLGGV